ncbi:MAG: hypothetical protein PHY95_03135 [Candidatus ainarchaeum sp.]|nr:hypothetical protein [Candidatus ainarchaeum sp.]
MTEAKGMKFADRLKNRLGITKWLEMHRAVHRAKELMEKACPTAEEKAERNGLIMRMATERAKELMAKKRLSARKRRERDALVKLLGKSGNSSEHELLKEWAVSGELRCRPDPVVLGGAIAAGGYDDGHVKRLLRAISTGELGEIGPDGQWVDGRSVPIDEQYYFAVLVSAESGALRGTLHKNHPMLALLEDRAAKVAAFIEGQMPGMVEKLRKEMEG